MIIRPKLESVALWASLMEALPEPAILIGPDDRVLAFNPPASFSISALKIGDLLAIISGRRTFWTR